jgi:hypothetical protein
MVGMFFMGINLTLAWVREANKRRMRAALNKIFILFSLHRYGMIIANQNDKFTEFSVRPKKLQGNQNTNTN